MIKMKQPKYRGLSKETNTWVYGFGWYETDYTDEYLEELGQLKQDAVLFTDGSPVICNIVSMGQYTSLTDKNQKEIYEGDIVNVNYYGGTQKLEKVHFYTVAGFAGLHPFTDSEFHWSANNCEVVGNIYENPDLI